MSVQGKQGGMSAGGGGKTIPMGNMGGDAGVTFDSNMHIRVRRHTDKGKNNAAYSENAGMKAALMDVSINRQTTTD